MPRAQVPLSDVGAFMGKTAPLPQLHFDVEVIAALHFACRAIWRLAKPGRASRRHVIATQSTSSADMNSALPTEVTYGELSYSSTFVTVPAILHVLSATHKHRGTF